MDLFLWLLKKTLMYMYMDSNFGTSYCISFWTNDHDILLYNMYTLLLFFSGGQAIWLWWLQQCDRYGGFGTWEVEVSPDRKGDEVWRNPTTTSGEAVHCQRTGPKGHWSIIACQTLKGERKEIKERK